MNNSSQLVTLNGPTYTFSRLYFFVTKFYRNSIISIVLCIQLHFTMIHLLWKCHPFRISKTYLRNRGVTLCPPSYVWSCSKLAVWGRVKYKSSKITKTLTCDVTVSASYRRRIIFLRETSDCHASVKIERLVHFNQGDVILYGFNQEFI